MNESSVFDYEACNFLSIYSIAAHPAVGITSIACQVQTSLPSPSEAMRTTSTL
jgi:hypothetical protein